MVRLYFAPTRLSALRLASGRERHRRAKHDFAFSGLIECGHCGSSIVGEIKKQRYVYYYCTGYRGKCGEPYVRQEVIEQKRSGCRR
jgi:Recombinase zinc beta ribbon domain